MRPFLVLTTVWLAGTFACLAQDRDRFDRQDYGRPAETIPTGTRISVRTEGVIEVRDQSDGRIFPATIAEDVNDPDGHVLIPRGSPVELIVQNVGHGEMAIDIDAIRVYGRRYMVSAEVYRDSRRVNNNTGAYVGGGALIGGVIGAIAGGGKGAIAGAAAGAAAGGATSVLTRGRIVDIPPESVIDFRLDRPLTVSSGYFDEDRGYDRDGYHYHNGYYDRRGGR